MPSTPTLPSLIPALKGDKGLYVSATWDAGAVPYRKDTWLKHDNALWLALRTTSVEPSDAVPEDWFKEIDLQGVSDDSEAAAASAALAEAWASQPIGEDVEGAPTGSRSALDRAAASKASADLSQAWSSQPVGEDVAGAAPSSRSAFHWAMTAANAVTAGLTSISNAISSGLSAISNAVSDGLTAIGLAKSSALSDVGAAGTTQIGNVNNAATAGITALQASQTPAFAFSTTTTDADPGNGNVRFNNAALASVTFIYFDNLDSAGNDVTGWLNTMANKGIIVVTPMANNGQRLMYRITGGVVDGSGYKKVPVAYLSGAVLPANTAVLAFTFNAAGVDGAAGTSTAASVRVASSGSNINLSGGLINGSTVDGVVVATNDLVLVKDQTTQSQSGIYVVPASGNASRATGFTTWANYPGAQISVQEGTINADTLWMCTANAGGTLGTTAITFAAVLAEVIAARGIAPTLSSKLDSIGRATVAVNRIKAAVAGGQGTLLGLFLPQLGVGLTAPGIVNSWTDQSGNGVVAGQSGRTFFSGADPRPVIMDNGDGLYMNGQTGLTINSGIYSDTSNIAFFYAVKFPVPTPYVDKATMDADTQTQCLLEEVTGDTLTTYSPDFSRIGNSLVPEANMVRGLYQREWNNTNISLRPILRANGSGSTYMELGLNRWGELSFNHFSSILVDQCKVFGYQPNPSLGPSLFDGKLHLIGVQIKDGYMRVALDGYEVGGHVMTGGSTITSLAAMHFNGSTRTTNPLTPVSGTRHTCGGVAFLKDTNLLTFNEVYNHLSDLLGTQRWIFPKRAKLILGLGQSLLDGSTSTGGDWTGPDGSIGELSTESPFSGCPSSITRDFLPNVFGENSHAPLGKDPRYWGPLGFLVGGNGVIAEAFCSGNGVETHDFGMAKALISHPKWPRDDALVFAGLNDTGTIMNAGAVRRSSPNVRPLSTIGVPLLNLATYEQAIAKVRRFADWCAERGTQPIMALWYDAKGFAGLTDTDIQTLLTAFSADVKQITGQASNVDGAGPQVNVSGNGLDNASSYLLDQYKLNADTARGTNGIYYYCLGPNSQFSTHVHYWGRPNYRARGWIGGKGIIAKAWLDGEDAHAVYPKTITRGANYVDFDYWVNRGLALVLGQTSYHIPAIQTGGIDTHGFEYSGGGLTITGVDFVNNVVTITNAAAGVVTWNGHGMPEGTPVSFENAGGALPTGLTAGNRFDKAGQVYFVINPTTNTFQVAATPGGAAINTTGTQSGTHTAYRRNKVRTSVSGATAAGHTVSYARVNSRGGNLADNDPTVCPYPYWDTTQPVVSGRQVFKDGLPVDGRQWGCHFGPTTLT